MDDRMDDAKSRLEKLKEEGTNFNKEIRQQTLTFILAGFSIVAGLAWNEAISSFIESVFPLSADSLTAKFLYATLITAIVVVFTIYLTKLLKKDSD